MKTYFARGPSLQRLLFCLFLMLLIFASPAIGKNAIMAPLVTNSMLLDIGRVGDNLVAVGERGHILRSSDNGSSWVQVAVPTRATLTAVFFIDHQTGWVVGHDQVILRTSDGGQSWQQVYENIAADSPLLDIVFLDQNHGYAIGAYGQFLETFDGGSNWEGRWISEDDFHLNQIIAVGEKVFIAAEAGYVYRSDDGGKNVDNIEPWLYGLLFWHFSHVRRPPIVARAAW